MRTTVTLDEDVERLLREAMYRSRCGFKEAFNAAVRTALDRQTGRSRRVPFVLKARPMGFRPGLDPAGLNKLADELKVENLSGESAEAENAMIIPDINLLLYAYDADSPFHAKAAGWWERCWSSTEPAGLVPVVVFRFVRVGTNPRAYWHPMTPSEAVGHVRSWLEQPPVELLEPGSCHVGDVLTLLEGVGTAGNLVTDAQIAAAVLHHDAVLHSTDPDFTRFANLRWFNPISGVGSSGRRRPKRA